MKIHVRDRDGSYTLVPGDQMEFTVHSPCVIKVKLMEKNGEPLLVVTEHPPAVEPRRPKPDGVLN